MRTTDPALEHTVRQRLDAGDAAGAVVQVVENAGREILAYQRAIARDDDLADDAFAIFCEHLLRGLTTWNRDRKLGPWLHVVARNAVHHARRGELRHRRGRCSDSMLDELIASTRATRESTRSRTLSSIAKARASLDPEDEALLVLRVDQQMSWDDVATALELPNDATTVARLRKRFQRVKEHIRARLDTERDGTEPSGDVPSGGVSPDRGAQRETNAESIRRRSR